jgi:hypothetical protein
MRMSVVWCRVVATGKTGKTVAQDREPDINRKLTGRPGARQIKK